MSEVDITQFTNAAEGAPADVVAPAEFDAFVAKAATIKGCTL